MPFASTFRQAQDVSPRFHRKRAALHSGEKGEKTDRGIASRRFSAPSIYARDRPRSLSPRHCPRNWPAESRSQKQLGVASPLSQYSEEFVGSQTESSRFNCTMSQDLVCSSSQTNVDQLPQATEQAVYYENYVSGKSIDDSISDSRTEHNLSGDFYLRWCYCEIPWNLVDIATEMPIDCDKIRRKFLSVMLSMLKSYKMYIQIPSTDDQYPSMFKIEDIFCLDAFLADAKADLHVCTL